MGTKKIMMTTTQHREMQKNLRGQCIQQAIEGGCNGNAQRIIETAKRIEDYVNTGKVK